MHIGTRRHKIALRWSLLEDSASRDLGGPSFADLPQTQAQFREPALRLVKLQPLNPRHCKGINRTTIAGEIVAVQPIQQPTNFECREAPGTGNAVPGDDDLLALANGDPASFG